MPYLVFGKNIQAWQTRYLVTYNQRVKVFNEIFTDTNGFIQKKPYPSVEDSNGNFREMLEVN